MRGEKKRKIVLKGVLLTNIFLLPMQDNQISTTRFPTSQLQKGPFLAALSNPPTTKWTNPTCMWGWVGGWPPPAPTQLFFF